jgi:hypothetical protein
MEQHSSALTFWRWLTPSNLGFAFLLFWLPWVEVKCQSPPARDPMGFRGQMTVVTQSGLQAVYGGFSRSRLFTVEEQQARLNQQKMGAAANRERVGAAPLLGVYIVLVVLAAVVGFALPCGVLRLVMVGVCSFAAAGLFLAQTIVGLPLVNEIRQQTDVQQVQQKAPGERINPGFKGGQDDNVRIVADYTPVFFVALVSTFGSLVLVGVEGLLLLLNRRQGPVLAKLVVVEPGGSGGYAQQRDILPPLPTIGDAPWGKQPTTEAQDIINKRLRKPS